MRHLFTVAVSVLMMVPPSSCMGSPKKQIRTLQQGKAAILVARFLPAGSQLVTASAGGTVVMWDVKTGERVWQISLDKQESAARESTVSHINDMDISRDGRTVALSYWRDRIAGDKLVGRDQGRVALIDAKSGQTTKTLAEESNAGGLAFSPDNHLLVGGDKAVRLWNVKTSQPLWSIDLREPVVNFVFSPDGSVLAIATEPPTYATPPEPKIGLYESRTGKFMSGIPRQRRNVGGLAFSPDGGTLAIVTDNLSGAQIDFWDLKSERSTATLKDHEGGITAIAISPDGRWLASGDLREGRGNLILREFAKNTAPRIHKFRAGVSTLSFSPDSLLLAVGFDNGQIVLLSTVPD